MRDNPLDGPAPNTPRERLLRDVVAYVAANGVADLSLRGLAAAIGTSHRMLIYHFGTKQRLLIEVVKAVEQRQRELLSQFLPPDVEDPAEELRAWWRHLSDPSLRGNARLFFELYGQALQGRPHTSEFLDDIVESWVAPAAELSIARGVAPPLARAHARLGVAVTRGLLLDLLATDDAQAVDAAMEAFIELYESWISVAH